jgi:hypothetical protein
VRVAGAAMAHSFATHCILLVGEDEDNEGCREKDVGWCREWVDGCSMVPEADIGKGKRVWSRAGGGIFARAE